MRNDTIGAIATVTGPAETVFGVLADPTVHAAIDDTCWAHEPLDDEKLTPADQTFRMEMCNDNQISSPPFAPDHLDNSLRHLAGATYPAPGR